jgi:hypothetical protein
MTKSIIEIAREAGALTEIRTSLNVDGDSILFMPEELEAFAAAIKAAHIEELCSVEMPEPVGYVSTHTSLEQDPYHIQFNQKLTHVYRDTAVRIDPVVTLDQLQQTVAAAVARHKQDWNRFHHLMKKYGLHQGRTDDDLLDILDKHLAALTAERDAYQQAADNLAMDCKVLREVIYEDPTK